MDNYYISKILPYSTFRTIITFRSVNKYFYNFTKNNNNGFWKEKFNILFGDSGVTYFDFWTPLENCLVRERKKFIFPFCTFGDHDRMLNHIYEYDNIFETMMVNFSSNDSTKDRVELIVKEQFILLHWEWEDESYEEVDQYKNVEDAKEAFNNYVLKNEKNEENENGEYSYAVINLAYSVPLFLKIENIKTPCNKYSIKDIKQDINLNSLEFNPISKRVKVLGNKTSKKEHEIIKNASDDSHFIVYYQGYYNNPDNIIEESDEEL